MVSIKKFLRDFVVLVDAIFVFGGWLWCHAVWSDDFYALAWKESDVEASLASPPDRLFSVGHVYHRYHITDLQKHKQDWSNYKVWSLTQ